MARSGCGELGIFKNYQKIAKLVCPQYAGHYGFEDNHGQLWFGVYNHGIGYLNARGDLIKPIMRHASSKVWSGGMNRWKQCRRRRSGYFRVWFSPDKNGYVWLPSNFRIIGPRKSWMICWMVGRTNQLAHFLRGDGRTRSCTGARHSAIMPDGTILVPTLWQAGGNRSGPRSPTATSGSDSSVSHRTTRSLI